jgi:hypothetical protein
MADDERHILSEEALMESEANLKAIIENTLENNPYLQCDCPVKFFIFHGHLCKDVNEGKKLINEIKSL